jgi:hypothetical protein
MLSDSPIATALENPNGDFNGSADSNLDEPLPDLTASWRIQGPDWHVKLNGMVRQIAIDDGIGGGANDETVGWAVGLTGAAIVPGTKKDRVTWYTVYGDGFGRYLEGGTGLGASRAAGPTEDPGRLRWTCQLSTLVDGRIAHQCGGWRLVLDRRGKTPLAGFGHRRVRACPQLKALATAEPKENAREFPRAFQSACYDFAYRRLPNRRSSNKNRLMKSR